MPWAAPPPNPSSFGSPLPGVVPKILPVPTSPAVWQLSKAAIEAQGSKAAPAVLSKAAAPAVLSKAAALNPPPAPPPPPPEEEVDVEPRTYLVSAPSAERSEAHDTIAGTYHQQGENHGRKFFVKQEQVTGRPDLKVFLFFWDIRDGHGYAGWWFGDRVAATKATVWARCQSFSVEVPTFGWKVPWDAPKPLPGMLTVSKKASPREEAEAAVATCKRKVEELEGELYQLSADVRERLEAQDTDNLDEASSRVLEREISLAELQRELSSELARARRAGGACQGAVDQMVGLLTATTSLQGQLAQVKSRLPQLKTPAELAKELENAKIFQDSLPALQGAVASVFEGVSDTASMAGRILDEQLEDGEASNAGLSEVEESAKEVQKKLTEVRNRVSSAIQDVKRFGSDVHKMAMKELSALQQQLVQAQQTVNVYKMFKKEHQSQVTTRASFRAVLKEFAALEEQAETTLRQRSAASEQGTEAEAKAAEQALTPLIRSVLDGLRVAEQKYSSAVAVKDQLSSLRERANRLKDKLEDTQKALRLRRDKAADEQVIKACREKVEEAEKAIEVCREAELPFKQRTKPKRGEESNLILQRCDAAATLATASLAQAATLLIQSTYTVEQRGDRKAAELASQTLGRLSNTMQQLEKKLAEFKGATSERKTATIVGEVVELVEAAEGKTRTLVQVATPLSNERSMDKMPSGLLQEALVKCCAADKECTAAIAEARNLVAERQETPNLGGSTGAVAAELSKLAVRMSVCQQDATLAQATIASADRFIQGKVALEVAEGQLIEAEVEAKKVERAAKRAAEQELSEGAVLEMVESSQKASSGLCKVSLTVDMALPAAPMPTKTRLLDYKERCRRALEALEAVANTTREPRERAQCSSFVREASRRADAAGDAMQKVEEAELPFLKGIEALPLAEIQESIKESDIVGEAAKVALAKAQEYVRARLVELSQFQVEGAVAAREKLSKTAERLNEYSDHLAQFCVELENRRKSAKVQEAEEAIAALQNEAKQATQAARPFLGGQAARMKEDELCEACLLCMERNDSAQSTLLATRAVVAKVVQEARVNPGLGETVVPLHTLQSKLAQATTEITKAKTAAVVFEGIAIARRTKQEVSDLLGEMDVELARASAAIEPLTKKGGEEFLLDHCMSKLAGALKERMQRDGLSTEDMTEQLEDEENFAKYLQDLPESSGREELFFSQKRQTEMFKRLDLNGDGRLSEEEFETIFRQKYICMKEIALTDSFVVEDSTNIARLQVGDVVEALGEARTDAAGAKRVECLRPPGAGSGPAFVTITGSSGSSFLKPTSAFDAFCATAEAALDASAGALADLGLKVNAKLGELPRPVPAPAKGAERREARISELRVACSSLAQRASGLQGSVAALKNELAAEKVKFADRRAEEDRAHEVAKEQKEAADFLKPATEGVTAAEAALQALKAAAEPLNRVSGEELVAFASPATVLEEAERLLGELVEAAAAARANVEQLQGKVPSEAEKGPMAHARVALATYSGAIETASKGGAQTLAAARAKCATIVDKCWARCGAALRGAKDLDELFQELASASSDGRIPEAAMCARLEALEGLDLSADHARLVCRWLGVGSVSRFAFLKLAQRFYRVAKPGVISEEAQIGTKTVRKLDVDELLEQLKEPIEDEKAGVSRMRARALRDGAEGWVTLQGNKGTTYLQEAEKPAYVCTADVTLDADASGASRAGTRTLKAGEVVEVLEGPRLEKLAAATWAQGQAACDGAMGWTLVADRTGAVSLRQARCFECSAGVAMTTELDIKSGRGLRKLEVGEVVEALGDPQEAGGLRRVRARASKDGKEGWVTLNNDKGGGTVYFVERDRAFTVASEVPLRRSVGEDPADVVRGLRVGEAFLVSDGPKEESPEPQLRFRGRALSDGAVGWLPLTRATKPWKPQYRCLKETPLHKSMALDEGELVRELAEGEGLELLDGPRVAASGEVLIHGRAERDGALGWAVVRDARGEKVLETPSEKSSPKPAEPVPWCKVAPALSKSAALTPPPPPPPAVLSKSAPPAPTPPGRQMPKRGS